MLSQPCEQATVLEETAPNSILIVEDDAGIAEALRVRLNRQGFRTSLANSGRLALTLARSDHPSLVLLDLGLPDMSGFEVCQELVDADDTSDIPVIILSGSDESGVIRRARAAGCHFFVHKPYDPNALLTLIKQAIDDSRQV